MISKVTFIIKKVFSFQNESPYFFKSHLLEVEVLTEVVTELE